MQDHNIFGSIFLGLNLTLHTHIPVHKYSKHPTPRWGKFEIDLSKSINPYSTLLLAIKAGRQSVQSSVESFTHQTAISSSSQTITIQQLKQGSSEWHDLRVGKITSSKSLL